MSDRALYPYTAHPRYVMKRPNGTYITKYMADRPRDVWVAAAEPLVVLHGHDEVEVVKALMDAGYTVVPFEIVEVED